MKNGILLSPDKHLVKMVKAAVDGLPLKLSDCQDLKAAINLFRDNSIDLVIVDLFLPETSGVEALTTLKKIDEKITAILLNRIHNRALMEKAFRHGAGDVLHYPLDPLVLRHTLMHRLERLENSGMVVFHQSET